MNRSQAKQAILSVMSEYADVPYDTLLDIKFVESYLDNVAIVYDGIPQNLYSNFAAYLYAFYKECKDRGMLSESQMEVILAIMDLFLSKAHRV